MSTHKCTVYGLNGAGSRLVIEVPDYIAPIACTPSQAPINKLVIERQIITRSRNIKPTNGNKLALR